MLIASYIYSEASITEVGLVRIWNKIAYSVIDIYDEEKLSTRRPAWPPQYKKCRYEIQCWQSVGRRFFIYLELRKCSKSSPKFPPKSFLSSGQNLQLNLAQSRTAVSAVGKQNAISRAVSVITCLRFDKLRQPNRSRLWVKEGGVGNTCSQA